MIIAAGSWTQALTWVGVVVGLAAGLVAVGTTGAATWVEVGIGLMLVGLALTISVGVTLGVADGTFVGAGALVAATDGTLVGAGRLVVVTEGRFVGAGVVVGAAVGAHPTTIATSTR